MKINISFVLFALCIVNTHLSEAAVQYSIGVNQIGYVKNWPKNGLVINSQTPDQEVLVIDADTDLEVASIKPSKQKLAQEGVLVQSIDFSEVRQEGRYYIKQNEVKSATFTIGEFPYISAIQSAMKTYYIQRCGVDVIADSNLSHEACHQGDALLANDDSINPKAHHIEATGGWHDAGDFGKYIAPASAAVSRLLNLYESYPAFFSDNQLNIPESGNGVPDLLDEVKVELEWMLKMQRQDGAVYRKLSGANWPKQGPPDTDTQTRFVYGVSTPETAKFASSLAIAARVYKSINEQASETYLKAAEKAWRWLETQEKQFIDIHIGDDSGSGKYLFSTTDQEASLLSDADDRLAAAIELYLSTSKSEYFNYIQENLVKVEYGLYEWKDMSALSLINLMKIKRDEKFKNIRKNIEKALMQRAKKALKSSIDNEYGLAIVRFVWGSNKMVAEEGINLVDAYQITKDQAYLKAAIAQLDYLLGKNPMAISYLTGYGERAARFPNHIHARSVNGQVKGFLVGGPNSLGQDNLTPKNLGALSYVDNDHAYASNENAIDYNSAFIGLLVHLMAISDSYQNTSSHPIRIQEK